MKIFKLIISVLDIAMATLMFFFQREQVNKATKIGFWIMILLYIANVIWIWK